MAAHTCALGVALLLLVGLALAETQVETKEKWSRPAQDRQSWIPVSPEFRDSDFAGQEEVATVLRPPEPVLSRQQKLIQSPRQGRGSGVPPQPFFPGDQSHLVRFPSEPVPQLRVPNGPPPQHFRNPLFLSPQAVPPGFPPSALTQPLPFQPQPIPAFNNPPPPPTRNGTFINANPNDDVQLLYVPVETIQGPPTLPSVVPSKQKNPSNKPFKNNAPLSFEEQLRQFVKEQGPLPQRVPSSQEQFQQDQQRFAVLREQEERRQVQEQAFREREERLRKEQEERIRKEQEERIRKEQEARANKEQELRERQEQEARARKEHELRLKKQQEEKEQEERARYEANLRLQQEQQERERQQFAHHGVSNLQAQENAFQQHLQNQTPLDAPTTPAPHQPPLAVYMESSRQTPIAVDDVLFALRDATSIPVIDRVPDASNPPPQVFVGPAEMQAPNGYTKFELPYLSSLDSNRVERKVDQLPFFVAPLSFQPPAGYSKIPFPAPHIGSVVVSQGRQNKQQRPLNPDPETILEDFSSAELPSISPAIPLLVNSLQSGRGSKSQRTHVDQQFLTPPPQRPFVEQQFVSQRPHLESQFVQSQRPHLESQFITQRPQSESHFVSHDQFVPNIPQFQPPQHFAQQRPAVTPPQFVSPQQYEEVETPVYTTEPVTEPPTTTTTDATTTSRRPLHSRGRPRPQIDATVAPQRTRTRPTEEDTSQERRPVHRGRRPGARQRTTTTTTTPEPVTEQEPTLVNSREEEQQPTLATSPSPSPVPAETLPGTLASPEPHIPQPQFAQPQFQDFEPSGFDFQRPFPTHQQGQGFHALPVHPAGVPQFEDSSLQQQPVPINQLPSVVRGHAFSQQHLDVSQETAAAIDAPSFDNQRFETPKKIGSLRNPEGIPTRQRQRPQEVIAEEPIFQRGRPTVFQSTVSTTPETILRYSATPHTPVTSTVYPPESAAITPHHVVKGEVGKLQQADNYPFISTPVPDIPSRSVQTEPSPTASVEPEIYNNEPTSTTVSPTAETTTSPLTYQTPTRTRLRQHDEVEPQEVIATSPRTRTRVSESGEQRFRGRGSTSREETNEDTTTVSPRVRTRIHGARVRTTTEAPVGLRITVADIPLRNLPSSDEPHSSETPTRTRGRFRGADRGRGAAVRQQLPSRGRQQENQEHGGIDLPKPVRHQIRTESSEIPVANDSPVYVPESQFESAFVPSLESQKSRPITTTTEAATSAETTTTRPGRGRFNNFGTANRVSQRRPHARTTTIASEVQDGPTTQTPSRTNVLRSSRRQHQTAARGTTSLRGTGTRLRKPITTTEVPQADEEESVRQETGVTHTKNPYVTIHREAPSAIANEVSNEREKEQPQTLLQSVPVTRFRQQRPQADEESYVEPESRYSVTPDYSSQYSNEPSPSLGLNHHNQGQYFVESTPTPPVRTTQAEQFYRSTPAKQYHRDEFESTSPQRHSNGRQRGRYVPLDDPENPEYGEESQRSERISIQQLEGALTASLFSKSNKHEEPQSNYDVVEEEEEYEPETNVEEHVANDEEEQTTEDATEIPDVTTTSSIGDITTTEPEPSTIKPALDVTTTESKRRRVRVRTRVHRPGDVFETAESQNVASVATNVLSPNHDKEMVKNKWKLALPNEPTIDVTNEGESEEEEEEEENKELIHITTSSPEGLTTTEAPSTTTPSADVTVPTTETVTEEITSTTRTPLTETITPVPEVTSTTEAVVTTDTDAPVTPRVLGTSTTTEISLETEICYRGRCVKTKVDADQMPIEK